MLASEKSVNVTLIKNGSASIKTNKSMKNLLIIAALVTGLASCKSKEAYNLTIERLEGQLQVIPTSFEMKAGDTIVVCDITTQHYGKRTVLYGNWKGEMPDNYCKRDENGVVFSRFYATAVVKDVKPLE